jgi:cobalt-zinc-cadmium efflux system membrane fusion protein
VTSIASTQSSPHAAGPHARGHRVRSRHLARLLLVLASGCSPAANDAETPTAPPPAAAVPEVFRLTTTTLARHPLAIVEAAMRPLHAHFSAPARASFDTDSLLQVTTTVRGRIVELPAKLGAIVRAGDPLAVLESSDLGEAQAELLLQERTAATAAPLTELAKLEWERGQKLLAEAQGLSPADVARREIDYQQALGTQQRAESAAAAAKNRLRLFGMEEAAIEQLLRSGVVQPRLVLRAARSGQVVERTAVLGAMAMPDGLPLFIIADPTVLWVLAEVPEARVADVVLDSPATVRLTWTPDVACSGTVTLLAPRLDPVTRTAVARIEVRQPPAALRAGMTCEARLDVASSRVGEGGPQLAVPESAVQRIDQRTVVFVPVPGDATAFTQRTVDVGRTIDGFVPVRSGLVVGDKVVADGSFVLKAVAMQSAAGEEK